MSKKSVGMLIVVALLTGAIHGRNFSHIRTGGFDYAINAVRSNVAEARWLARHHDVVVGLAEGDEGKLPLSLYNTMKAANPNVQFVQYLAFNTLMPSMVEWMMSWCERNDVNPEEMFYHYYSDTEIPLRAGGTRTSPGYGGGSATSLQDARVRSSWWSGNYPNVNPSSQKFRDAFNELALETITLNASAGLYCDGLFLDSFEGSVEDYFDIKLENTIEMRELGLTTAEAARAKVAEDLVAARDSLESYLSQRIGRTIRVFPNAGDVDNVFNWYDYLYSEKLSPKFNELAIEFFITSRFSSVWRIPRFKELYERMEDGTTFIINSQTNFAENVPFGFEQFILASHYLINHDNGIFFYHKGGPGYYGPIDNSVRESHWHRNIEVDIGAPVARSQADFWGENGTDRFYVFHDGGDNLKVLAREYERALVIAKFGAEGGWDNIGNGSDTYSLGGQYHRLLADNSLGPIITGISLGESEGAILIKREAADAISSIPIKRLSDAGRTRVTIRDDYLVVEPLSEDGRIVELVFRDPLGRTLQSVGSGGISTKVRSIVTPLDKLPEGMVMVTVKYDDAEEDAFQLNTTAIDR